MIWKKKKFLVVLFILLASLLLPVSVSSASVSYFDFEISPENPVRGDLVKIEGRASPFERVPIRISFEEDLNVVDGRYEWRVSSIQIPTGENRFTVRARDVNRLDLAVRLGFLWITRSADAVDGIATISQSNVPGGTYDLRISGKSDSSTVRIKVEAEVVITADETGVFRYTYNTSPIPAGEFVVSVGEITKTVELLERGFTPAPTPTPTPIPRPAETTPTPTPTPTTPPAENLTYPSLTFGVDRDAYSLGEPVVITITNIGNTTVSLPNAAPWYVEKTETKAVVYSPISAQVITLLEPGQSLSWTWNQRTDAGEKVQPGIYRIGIRWNSRISYTQKFEILSIPALTPTPPTPHRPDPRPSPVPDPVPAPRPWWEIPGFYLVFAIAGLLAVAYLVLRKRN